MALLGSKYKGFCQGGKAKARTRRVAKSWMLLIREHSYSISRAYEKICCTRRHTRSRTHPRRPVRCWLPRRHLRLGGISRRHHVGAAARLSPPLLGGTTYSEALLSCIPSYLLSHARKQAFRLFLSPTTGRTTQVSKYRRTSAGSLWARAKYYVPRCKGVTWTTSWDLEHALACHHPTPFLAQPARGQHW